MLNRKFYARNAKKVAIDLLGKILVRNYKGKLLKGRIVETEAYFGKEDPASRAAYGSPRYCVEMLYGKVGLALIYMVHGNWLFNVVAHEKGKGGAVLIRAIEPLEGIDIMLKLRKCGDVRQLTNGPGKLCKALAIDKSLNGNDLTKADEIWIEEGEGEFEIGSSHRIGVTRDLPQKLRFFIRGNPFVSL